MRTSYLLPLAFSLLFAGCVENVLTSPEPTTISAMNSPVATGSQLPTDALAKDLYQTLQDKVISENPSDSTIIISTFVDSSNLDKTNRLGRLVSEELIARMFKFGFQIVEFRATESLLLRKKEGDFALSREVDRLRDSYEAEYIVIGTYTEASNSVFLNARLVDLETAKVLSVSSHEVIKSDEIIYLLEDEKDPTKKKSKKNEPLMPSVYER